MIADGSVYPNVRPALLRPEHRAHHFEILPGFLDIRSGSGTTLLENEGDWVFPVAHEPQHFAQWQIAVADVGGGAVALRIADVDMGNPCRMLLEERKRIVPAAREVSHVEIGHEQLRHGKQ